MSRWHRQQQTNSADFFTGDSMQTTIDNPPLPWRRIATSSLLSVTAHLLVLGGLGLSLRGCVTTGPGQSGGEVYRDVGLFMVDGLEDSGGEDGQQQSDDASPVTNPQNQTSDEFTEPRTPVQNRVPSTIPNDTSLIQPLEQTADGATQKSPFSDLLGPGSAIAGLGGSSAGGGDLIRSGESGAARRTGGTGGEGDTTFMDIAGTGKTFVYVIDTSSSMDGARLRVAQQQLKASLRLLRPEHQFAVIFYNEYRQRLKLRRQAPRPMYYASEVNRMLAVQEVDRVVPDAGTDHKPALEEALALKPDVIYFLTDGDEPSLSAGDLRDIRHLAGKTSIHVIQFSNGAYTSRTANWLQKLAQQCQGEYRIIAVQNR